MTKTKTRRTTRRLLRRRLKAHSKVQDALSLPPGLVSLFPLLPEKNHFLPCNGCFTPLTYISVLCQSCPKLFLFVPHLSR